MNFSTLAVLAGFVVALCSACSAPPGDERDTNEVSSSEAALTSSNVLLEKSRIEVFLDQQNTLDNGYCIVSPAKFRVTYQNSTLPGGTKITLHAGESYSNQYWIGDGFGWGNYSKGVWGEVRDLAMSESSGTYQVETSAKSYTQYPSGQYYLGMPDPSTYAPELSFVFRLELPDGTVLWDNRLRQDYWVGGNGPDCTSGSTNGSVFRAGWGPY